MRNFVIALAFVASSIACAGRSPSVTSSEGEGIAGEGEGAAGEGEGASTGEGEGEGDGEGEGSVDGPSLCGPGCLLTPHAPTSVAFAWQGKQSSFHEEAQNITGGTPVTQECSDGKVVIEMWDAAVCYVGVDDQLYCAGRIGDTVFGNSFAPTGQLGVDQLLGSPTFNSSVGSAVCAHHKDGTANCLGYGGQGGDAHAGIYWGQFNTANGLEPGPVWTQWGTRDDIAEIMTGTMDQVCALYVDGTGECAGFSCGLSGAGQTCPDGNTATLPLANTPLGSGIASMWMDNAGQAHMNDAVAFREANSRSTCIVTAGGLACNEPPEVAMAAQMAGAPQVTDGLFNGWIVSDASQAGHVVDGGWAGMGTFDNTVCWLVDDGDVFCAAASTDAPAPDAPLVVTQLFAGHTALAIAINGYSRFSSQDESIDPARCAAMADGSLWCIGANSEGKLGTGDLGDLVVETQVAPPGTVRVNCPVLAQ